VALDTDPDPDVLHSRGGGDSHADLLLAAAVAAAAWLVYAATACRTVYVGDSPEIALAAATFGVPHPPGYPLHTLLSGLFVRALPFGDIAFCANLASATAAAAAVALVVLAARRLSATRLGAVTGALALAFGLTFWSQAVAAEVYAFDAMLFALALLAALRLRTRATAASFALAGVCLGLLVGHRPIHVLELLGFALLLELARRRQLRPRADLLCAFLAAAATGLVYLYLPWASRRDPPLDIGDPQTWPAFLEVVTARTYRRHLGAGGAGEDFGRLWRFASQLVFDLGPAALLGAWALLRRQRRGEPARRDVVHRQTADLGSRDVRFAALLILLPGVGFTAFYNILDIAPYWLPAHVLLAVLAARCLATLPRWASLGACLLALALLPLNFASNDLRRIDLADRYARDALLGLAPGAILIASGDTSTHALWYRQAVLGERRDVAVVRSGDPPDWYVRQLARRHPEVAWPEYGEVEHGTWFRSLLIRNLGTRPVCFLDWPPLRLQQWGAADLAAHWYGRPDGVRYEMVPAHTPLRAEHLASARRFWAQAEPPTAAELSHADVQVLMTAHAYQTSRYAFACALLQVEEVTAALAELQAILAADPDQMERRMLEAYRSIGQERRVRGRTELVREAIARRAQGADAMLRVLAAGM